MEIQIERTQDYEVLAKLNESVQSLHQKLYPEEFKTFDFGAVAIAFEKMLSNPETYAFLAKQGSKAIGYIFIYVKHRNENEFQFAKTVLYIDQISVEEEFRNQGIAQRLLAQVKLLAGDLNIAEIQLDFWDKNEEANQFFKAQGFEHFNNKMKMNI